MESHSRSDLKFVRLLRKDKSGKMSEVQALHPEVQDTLSQGHLHCLELVSVGTQRIPCLEKPSQDATDIQRPICYIMAIHENWNACKLLARLGLSMKAEMAANSWLPLFVKPEVVDSEGASTHSGGNEERLENSPWWETQHARECAQASWETVLPGTMIRKVYSH